MYLCNFNDSVKASKPQLLCVVIVLDGSQLCLEEHLCDYHMRLL